MDFPRTTAQCIFAHKPAKEAIITKKRTLKAHHDLRYLDEIPPAPPHFDEELTATWNQTCDILMDRYELTEGDLTLVETYCTGMSAHRKLVIQLGDNHVVEDRFGQLTANPLHQHIQRYAAQLSQITSLLGLNPKNRTASWLTSLPRSCS